MNFSQLLLTTILPIFGFGTFVTVDTFVLDATNNYGPSFAHVSEIILDPKKLKRAASGLLLRGDVTFNEKSFIKDEGPEKSVFRDAIKKEVHQHKIMNQKDWLTYIMEGDNEQLNLYGTKDQEEYPGSTADQLFPNHYYRKAALKQFFAPLPRNEGDKSSNEEDERVVAFCKWFDRTFPIFYVADWKERKNLNLTKSESNKNLWLNAITLLDSLRKKEKNKEFSKGKYGVEFMAYGSLFNNLSTNTSPELVKMELQFVSKKNTDQTSQLGNATYGVSVHFTEQGFPLNIYVNVTASGIESETQRRLDARLKGSAPKPVPDTNLDKGMYLHYQFARFNENGLLVYTKQNPEDSLEVETLTYYPGASKIISYAHAICIFVKRFVEIHIQKFDSEWVFNENNRIPTMYTEALKNHGDFLNKYIQLINQHIYESRDGFTVGKGNGKIKAFHYDKLIKMLIAVKVKDLLIISTNPEGITGNESLKFYLIPNAVFFNGLVSHFLDYGGTHANDSLYKKFSSSIEKLKSSNTLNTFVNLLLAGPTKYGDLEHLTLWEFLTNSNSQSFLKLEDNADDIKRFTFFLLCTIELDSKVFQDFFKAYNDMPNLEKWRGSVIDFSAVKDELKIFETKVTTLISKNRVEPKMAPCFRSKPQLQCNITAHWLFAEWVGAALKRID